MAAEEISLYLNFLRRKSGKTYEDIDRATGISKSTVGRLCTNGIANPSMESVEKIIAYLDGSMAELESGAWKQDPLSAEAVPDGEMVSLEAYRDMMAMYEKRLAEKDEVMNRHLAEKNAEMERLIALKDDHINSLARDKKHLSRIALGALSILIGLYIVDLLNPSLGWARWQASKLMDGLIDSVRRFNAWLGGVFHA